MDLLKQISWALAREVLFAGVSYHIDFRIRLETHFGMDLLKKRAWALAREVLFVWVSCHIDFRIRFETHFGMDHLEEGASLPSRKCMLIGTLAPMSPRAVFEHVLSCTLFQGELPKWSERAERRAAQRVEEASDVRDGAERRGAQRVEKASVVGGAKPIALVAPKPLAKRGLMIRIFSQDALVLHGALAVCFSFC